jgi:23S rRNA (uracil1939-C5)-methyltransferase
VRGAVQLNNEEHVSFTLEGGTDWPSVKRFFSKVPSVRSLWWAPARGTRRQVDTRDATATPSASFVQVNAKTAALMLDYTVGKVRAHNPSHVIDAYAGAGDTSAVLANQHTRLTAIELDRDAARWAAVRLQAPSAVIAKRVEDALPSALPADVVILNPPRTGVDARVCETLSAAAPSPRAIIYVSCDPATLARDIARLKTWRIASLMCFDLFPQTAHVETVCELVPNAA